MNHRDNNIAVLAIDSADNVTDTGIRIPLPGSPLGQFGAPGIAINNDSMRAYVSNYTNGTVSVVDLTTNIFTGIVIPVGGYPSEIALVSRTITVGVDIKPGSFPNSINLGSGGTVPVAILSTTAFDATTVDPTTVTLASASVKLRGKGTPMASFEEVNGDGLLDLVVHIETEALQLNETDTEAVLAGATFDGTPIRGVDTVRVVP